MEIVVYGILFWNLYIFLVNENLVSKYEKLLILTDIAISTLRLMDAI
jgi:hypothetical protein